MSDKKNIFDEIVNHPHEKKLAVFDLDSTLFGVSSRSQAILRDLVQEPEFRDRFPQAIEALSKIELSDRDWGIKKPLERLGLGEVPGLFRAAKDYWNQHFFSNHYLVHDRPYPGAIEFVTGLASKGVDIYYLTGRDEPNMREGTIEILKKWGFPTEGHEERLHMKPHKGHSMDEEYKSLRFKEILDGNEETWFFENEPVILHRVREDHPNVNIIYIDTVHSGRALAPEGLPIISWD
jgi:hypothetical protein